MSRLVPDALPAGARVAVFAVIAAAAFAAGAGLGAALPELRHRDETPAELTGTTSHTDQSGHTTGHVSADVSTTSGSTS